MKMIKLFTHPVVIIIAFLLILISGEHLGGFYLLYILLGLSHGAVHSLLAIDGMAYCFLLIINTNSSSFLILSLY